MDEATAKDVAAKLRVVGKPFIIEQAGGPALHPLIEKAADIYREAVYRERHGDPTVEAAGKVLAKAFDDLADDWPWAKKPEPEAASPHPRRTLGGPLENTATEPFATFDEMPIPNDAQMVTVYFRGPPKVMREVYAAAEAILSKHGQPRTK